MESPPRLTLLVLLASTGLTAPMPPAVAASSPRSALLPVAACAPAPDDAAVVPASVSAGGDVVLADGRTIRLAGLDLARATPTAPGRLDRLRAALLSWARAPVVLHSLDAADRWGRVPAMLFRADPPEEVGAALLDAGLARVAPEASVHACAPPRLSAEDRARAAGREIWTDPAYAVLAPGDAQGLADQAGGLAIVQGILSVRESRGAFYLSLGRDRRGFSAAVPRRAAKLFARSGLDLRDYEGSPVRLRGDLDARFGPRMRLTDPDAVESLEPGSIAGGG